MLVILGTLSVKGAMSREYRCFRSILTLNAPLES